MMASDNSAEPFGNGEEESIEEWREAYLHKYYSRVPACLALPFVHAATVLRGLKDIHRFDLELSNFSHETFASNVEMFLENVHAGHKCLSAVEEEFGAAAEGLAEFGGYVASSWHRLMVTMGHLKGVEILTLAGLMPESAVEMPETYFGIFRGFDREEFISAVEEIEERFAEWLRPFGSELGEHYGRLLAHLEQELFRAWKRKYPSNDSKYEAFGDSPEVKTLIACFSGSKKTGKRQCCERDQLWLEWHEQGKQTQSKIRDRWNGMPQHERREICPDCCHTIARNGFGTDVVKKGIKKAREDRKVKEQST